MDYCDCDLSSRSTSSSSSGLSSYSTSSVLTPANNNVNINNNSNTNNNPAKKQRSSAACKYKGVVPQPNGRWGAQLYNGNKRVWIGTYDCQHQAAHAYDMAAIRFRGAQAVTNYPVRHYGRPHLEFLVAHTHNRVIDMLRNHTYEEELARFMRARMARKQDPGSGGGKELLFKKVMTPSDVGRLHRLVIPKHHAQSYLPNIGDNKGGEIMLSFEDVNKNRVWRFKYCYWKSSQNYVLTKGWGEFVKDKGLKPGDTVLFYCTNLADSQKWFSIDTCCKEATITHVKDVVNANNGNDVVALSTSKVLLRLFGVDICLSTNPSPVIVHGHVPIVVSNNSSGRKDGSSCTQLDGGEVVQSKIWV